MPRWLIVVPLALWAIWAWRFMFRLVVKDMYGGYSLDGGDFGFAAFMATLGFPAAMLGTPIIIGAAIVRYFNGGDWDRTARVVGGRSREQRRRDKEIAAQRREIQLRREKRNLEARIAQLERDVLTDEGMETKGEWRL
jgi:hypothetical protein